MRPLLLLTLLFLYASAASYTLEEEYGYRDDTIMSTTLFSDMPGSFELFAIPPHVSRYRISAEEVVERFKAHGVEVDAGEVRYLNFVKISPISTEALERDVAAYYTQHYPSIAIAAVAVTPRVYTPELPAEYTVTISDTAYKSARGTFYITGSDGTKLFFDYAVDAKVRVFTARRDLRRDAPVDAVTVQRSAVPLDTLNSPPLDDLAGGTYRLKRHLKSGEVVMRRHVEVAPLVLRDADVLATLKTGNVLIEFHAIALQDGALHDMISIQKPDGKRLKAKVVGENKVEIE